MTKFDQETLPGSQEASKIKKLLGKEDFMRGTSDKGAVEIKKWPNGTLEVHVWGNDGINTNFQVSEGMGVKAEAEKPASKKFSHEGGGIEEQQNLSPKFSLDDVLASFNKNAEEAK